MTCNLAVWFSELLRSFKLTLPQVQTDSELRRHAEITASNFQLNLDRKEDPEVWLQSILVVQKSRLFKSNVVSVQFYGCENWLVTD